MRVDTSLDIEDIRGHFPALKSGFLFGDNSGGSQVLSEVASRTSDYLLESSVSGGADYPASQLASKRIVEAIASAAVLWNASPAEVLFGPSSTAVVNNIALAIDNDINDGEEIITTGEHESNATPWKRLVKRRPNVNLKFWNHTPIAGRESNPYAVELSANALLPLITERTRLIAFSATSNILGTANDLKEIIRRAREVGRRKGVRKLEFIVDCVAFSPHRRIDVKDWDVDYAYFSFYKIFGPHLGTAFVRESALRTSLTSLVHHFLKVEGTSGMLLPGGHGAETVYGSSAVLPYLLSLSSWKPTMVLQLKSDPEASQRQRYDVANFAELRAALGETFESIAEYEQKTHVEPVIQFLRSKWDRGVRVVGDDSLPVRADRTPTISFVVLGLGSGGSRRIVQHLDSSKIGIRNGYFYTYGLVSSLQPPIPDMNVVRVSFVHYTTEDEIRRVIRALDSAINAVTSAEASNNV
ncbi:PLP-dependent transferase [Sistotremastrum niveocremeum HHB9708]|uniref:PLP-dependent transferase n=1 Tax=Sistotremastrum niveocremeum HHB9708 TaxID=1314777 RepID=A0A164T1E5_9AGAM|nr:PLP-dependent transferase [Sistotremastrum niveocremeum HHB9708]